MKKQVVVMNVCAKHPPFDGRVYDKISKTLVKCGYEVHNTSPNIESEETDDGIYLHGFEQKPGLFNRIRSHSALMRCIEQVKPDCMACHEPDALFVAYRYYRKEKKHRKVKLFFDCHEAYEHWFDHATPFLPLNRLAGILLMAVINRLVRRIDGVTSVNHTMTERFRKFNANSHFLPSVFKRDRSDNYQSNGSTDLVYMGSFGQSKQTEMFIGAAKLLRDKGIPFKIAIIGGRRPGEKTEGTFEQIVEQEGLQDYFDYKGWMDREQAFEELSRYGVGILRFDSYTMPGNYAMPNKLFEYMSLGLALLSCSLNLEIRQVVESEQCGVLIESETAGALADAIEYILKHPEAVETMKRNAYQAAAERYNWESFEPLLRNLVED